MKAIVFPFLLLGLVGCNPESDSQSDDSSEDVIEPTFITVGSVTLDLSTDIIEELQSHETINAQLDTLYEEFEPQLDRSDILGGEDENSNGIRDDLEAVI